MINSNKTEGEFIMQEFFEYYNANKKQYKYTIKIAQNDFTAEQAAVLERYLERYKLVDFKPFSKTPIQQNPLDFPNVKDSEVYITEVTMEYPATASNLVREIAKGVKLSENCIAVYNENDPRLDYTEQWLERVVNKDEFKENYETSLGSKEKWPEEAPYGEKYNIDFLKSLKKVGDNNEYVTNDLIPSQKVDKVEASKVEFDGPGKDSVLNDRWRNATKYTPKKNNTLMSKPVEEK